MKIVTRIRRRVLGPPAPTTHQLQSAQLDDLAARIADSHARRIEITDRIAGGRALPGDEARLRIQRDITASYQKRLEKIDLPTGTADDAEAWLRSAGTPRGARARQDRPH
jgi:hypothetical protein